MIAEFIKELTRFYSVFGEQRIRLMHINMICTVALSCLLLFRTTSRNESKAVLRILKSVLRWTIKREKIRYGV